MDGAIFLASCQRAHLRTTKSAVVNVLILLTEYAVFDKITLVLSEPGRCLNTVGGYLPPNRGETLLCPLSVMEGGGQDDFYRTVSVLFGTYWPCQSGLPDYKKEVTAPVPQLGGYFVNTVGS